MVFLLLVTFFKPSDKYSNWPENSSIKKNERTVLQMIAKKKIRQPVQTSKITQIPENKIISKENPIEKQKSEEVVSENSEKLEDSENEYIGESEFQSSAQFAEANKIYKTYVLKRIAEKRIYPSQARKKGYEGKVKLHVVINNSGEIQLLEILIPCEYELLNDAAIKTVKTASPFKSMPDIMKLLDFNFVLDFKLSRN